MTSDIESLRRRLREIEESCPSSPLAFYRPAEDQARLFHEMCDTYRRASQQTRALIQREVAGKKGIVNHLLAFIGDLIEDHHSSGQTEPLMTALAAASIRGDGPDFRDFNSMLAALFMTFKEAGLDAIREFNEIGGGVPHDFHTYAEVRRRLRETEGEPRE